MQDIAQIKVSRATWVALQKEKAAMQAKRSAPVTMDQVIMEAISRVQREAKQ